MKKKIISIVLVLMLCVCTVLMAGCGKEEVKDDGNTLIYGSSDYTAINPALYEHGEINLLLFAGLTAHTGTGRKVGFRQEDQYLQLHAA